MFATPHCLDALRDPARKRPRDDDEAANDAGGLGGHRDKRFQSLPLRSSTKVSQHWPPMAAITPVHPTCNDALPRSHFSPCSSSPVAASQPTYIEVDMADPSATLSPSPYRVDESAASDEPDILGRMPTPIQPSFAAQVRGQNCEWAGPGLAVKTLNGIVNMGHHQMGFSNHHSVPRAMAAAEPDWHTVHNNRRLPSPISEAGDSSQASLSATSVVTQDGYRRSSEDSGFLSAMQCSWAPSMPHPNATMDAEAQPPHQSLESDSDTISPSPGRRGHTRSKHTVNSWTWQPGMKKSFSIGYRSDCEKCRLKVPGHFNHIIIS